MKQKILELLKEKREINITDFHKLIPQSKGEYAIYISVKEGINPNILWMAKLTQDFIKAFNELLIEEKLIEWKPISIVSYLFDGSPIYDMELFQEKYLKKEVECWLPIVITLKQ